jgi:uncharacterized protein
MDVRTKDVTGTAAWTEVSTEFTTGDERSVVVHCLFGGYGGATGSAWWDDVYLQPVGAETGTAFLSELITRLSKSGSDNDRKAVSAALAARGDEVSRKLMEQLNSTQIVSSAIVRTHRPDPTIHARGLEIYNKTCIACHGPEGKGVPLAFPPLDGSSRLVGNPDLPIRAVLHGLQGPVEAGGATFNNIMAPLAELNDRDVADVLTYVRQSWSNDAPAVSAGEVAKTRAKHADRKTPWTIKELE